VAVHPVNPVELITEGRMRTREPWDERGWLTVTVKV
jgi:hypothetical protein